MDKGKLLVSANGKGHSAITTWWIIEVVGAVLFVALCYCIAEAQGFNKTLDFSRGGMEMISVKNGMYNAWIGVGVLGAVLCLVAAGMVQARISRTAVNVYEKCIEGTSVVPKFPLALMLYWSISSLQLVEFRLTYDKISSVDVVNVNTVIINATNVQHKIYAMNAKEIRDAILSRKDTVGVA